jgi:hypothetical protein
VERAAPDHQPARDSRRAGRVERDQLAAAGQEGGREVDSTRRVWELRYDRAVALKLEGRIDKKHFR